METKVYYCDYCGKRLIKRPKMIRTVWDTIVSSLTFGTTEIVHIAGDGCEDCYNSYKRWVKSRLQTSVKRR